MNISIIIPVFNEEATVAKLVEKVLEVKLPKNLQKEIIIVNDGSTDQTLNLISKFKNSQIKIVNHAKNLGKGAAVKTGLKNASGEIIIIQDADLEYDPNDFCRLLGPILDGRAEVVYGTRLKNFPFKIRGKDRTPIPTHYLGNKFLTYLTNLLYFVNLTDMETCYKLFKKDTLAGIKLKSHRFNIEPEITAKLIKKGYKIYELPIKVHPRGFNEGKKINWRDGFSAIWALVKYRFID